MFLNLNTNIISKIKSSFEGPSSDYYKTKNRFDEILQTKLGVNAYYGIKRHSSGISNPSTVVTVEMIYSDVRLRSGATGDLIDAKLKGTAMEGLGDAFVRAEEKYGVNAWFLTGLAIHESGFGSSRIAKDKNNLFGFQAYDSSPYESARTFASKQESVDHVAKYISEAYLTPGGTYYNGVSIDSIGKRYATDPNWSSKIKKHMVNLLTE